MIDQYAVLHAARPLNSFGCCLLVGARQANVSVSPNVQVYERHSSEAWEFKKASITCSNCGLYLGVHHSLTHLYVQQRHAHFPRPLLLRRDKDRVRHADCGIRNARRTYICGLWPPSRRL